MSRSMSTMLVNVVQVVVAVLPLVAGAHVVPPEFSRVVVVPAHPVVPAVHHIGPISMLSRIFDADSAATPAIHAGGRKPRYSRPRPPILEAKLHADDVVQVVAVLLAEVCDDAGP